MVQVAKVFLERWRGVQLTEELRVESRHDHTEREEDGPCASRRVEAKGGAKVHTMFQCGALSCQGVEFSDIVDGDASLGVLDIGMIT